MYVRFCSKSSSEVDHLELWPVWEGTLNRKLGQKALQCLGLPDAKHKPVADLWEAGCRFTRENKLGSYEAESLLLPRCETLHGPTWLLWIRSCISFSHLLHCLRDHDVYIRGPSSIRTVIYQPVGLIFDALEAGPYLYLRLVWPSRRRSFRARAIWLSSTASLIDLLAFYCSSLLFLLKRGMESRFSLLVSDIRWEVIDSLDRLRS